MSSLYGDPDSRLNLRLNSPPKRVRRRVADLVRLGAFPDVAYGQAWGEYRYGDLGGWPRFWRKLRGKRVNFSHRDCR